MRVEDQPAGEKWIRMTRDDGGTGNCQGIATTAARHQFMHKPLSNVHSYPGSLSRRPVRVCDHKPPVVIFLTCTSPGLAPSVESRYRHVRRNQAY